jgi:two-component system sensor histidine kinase/response regulator
MKTILIIEDDPSIRNEICDILQYEGYKVLFAENGKIGHVLAIGNIPDLILCDILMPEMDGHELLQQLRSDIKTSFIRFVFITALADRKNFRSGMEHGADDYLVKPFTREELLRTVSAQLSKAEVFENRIEENLDHLRKRIISHLPHEIRTPLNGIIGLGDYLIENSANVGQEELTEIANAIIVSGNTLHELLEKYLIYIQLETCQSIFSSESSSDRSSAAVEELVNDIANKHRRPGDLNLSAGEMTMKTISNGFSIIVKELTENAFKFSKPGTPVTIKLSERNGIAEFSAHNSGMVFSEGSIQNIGVFIQFDRKLHEQQGSGLGLIISKKIAALLHGSLDIKSSNENGTTVRVNIPLK